MEEILKSKGSIESEIEAYLAPERGLVEDGAAELGELAFNLLNRGKPREAISCLQKALRICSENSLSLIAINLNIRMAECFLNLNETKKAIKYLEKARSAALGLGGSKHLWNVLLMLARSHKGIGAPDEALRYYKDCITSILADWSKFNDIELMSSFFSDKMEPFLEIVDILSTDDTDKIAEAYRYVRLSKAKTISEFRGKIPRSSETADLEKKEIQVQEIRTEVEHLWQKVHNIQQEIEEMTDEQPTISGVGGKVNKIEDELMKKMNTLKAHARRMEREEDRILRQMRESAFKSTLININEKEFQLSDLQPFLSQGNVAIDFFFTQNKLILFLLTKNELLREPVDISHKELIDEIKHTGFIELKEKKDVDKNFIKNELPIWNSALDSLVKLFHDVFMIPINNRLKIGDDSTICFIPQGILHHLPLHIARWESNAKFSDCLLQTNATFYLPNIAFMPRHTVPIKNEDRSLLAIANPEKDDPELLIQGVEGEVEQISKYFNKKKILRWDKANPENVIKECSKHDVIHFACHGLVRGDIPEFSYLRLARGKKLRVVDIISRMHLNADLIVLSSCNTAISRLDPSDEMMALSRAFIYAGARTIIASLWKVEDNFTKTFMNRFYYLWIEEGLNKVQALQHAQKELLQISDWSSPFYWAPFVLTGDPE